MSAIRTLLVGGGRMGTAHLQGIARLPELAVVTAAVEPHEAHRDRLRREHGIERLYDDLDSALEAEPVEAVFICTPNHLHAEYALACLRSGKHVFVEKPLALTVADADALVAAAEAGGRLLMSGQTLRFAPRLRQVKALLDSWPDRRAAARPPPAHEPRPRRRRGQLVRPPGGVRRDPAGGSGPTPSTSSSGGSGTGRPRPMPWCGRSTPTTPSTSRTRSPWWPSPGGGAILNVALSFHHRAGYEWTVAGSGGVIQLSSTSGALLVDGEPVPPEELVDLPGEEDIHREFFSAIRDSRPLAQAAGSEVPPLGGPRLRRRRVGPHRPRRHRRPGAPGPGRLICSASAP